MESTCRLCSCQTSPLTSAFSLKNGRIIADMVTIICPIRIDISDSLPQSVCTSCIKIVYDAVDLREKSLKSDENFRSGSEITKVKSEVDPFNQEVWLEDVDNQAVTENSESDEEQNLLTELTETPKKGTKTCHLCGLQLAHASNVKRHIQRYHDTSFPFECSHCTYRFKTATRLESHTLQLHYSKAKSSAPTILKHQSNLCDFCGQNFTNRTLLERHLTVSHRPKDPQKNVNENFMCGSYPCNLCDKTFTMRHNLNRHHRRFHSTDLKFKCTDCNDRFRTEVHLSRHVVRVHENRNGIFNKISQSSIDDEEVLDACQYCGQEFSGSKYRYERHMILMHEKEVGRIYSCDICPKKFVFLKSLKYHVEVHRKRAREEHFKFQCDICLRKFLSEDKYRHHVMHSHDETSPNVCHLCGKTFESRKKFNYHMQRHQDIRDFQCEHCEMKFLQARHLERHKTTHSDERPYLCTFSGCDKSFKMSDVLRKHLKNVHNIEGGRKVGD